MVMPGSLSGSARGPKLLAYLVILLVILLLLGGDRIASTGRGLGSAIRGFKKGFRGEDPKPSMPPPSVRQKVPKLLPAKGESSAKDEPDADPEKDS